MNSFNNSGICVLIAFLFLSHNKSFAQEVMVDPLTGRALMNFPLWTIRAGDISAPIGLFYTGGNGIKVKDKEGSAGMGWMMTAGGTVSRELRGLPDDFVGALSGVTSDARNGWLHQNVCRQTNNFAPIADQDLTTCTDEGADWTALNGLIYANNDTEPDIFSFNAPGLSGQFVFDNNKQIRPVPYQDLRIVPYRQGADSLIYKIEITNNLGVKYTFQNGDKVTRQTYKQTSTTVVSYFTTLFNYFQSPATYYSSWYLVSVASPSGNNLLFTYGNDFTQVNPTPSQIYNNTTGQIETVYSIIDNISGQVLTKITGNNESASFNWNGGVVGSVVVKDLIYSQTKKINLTYNYIQGANTPSPPTRAFLIGLNEEVNCKAFPGYQFTYCGIDFTTGTTPMVFDAPLKQDLFGYFNGSATSLVPEIYNNESATNGERNRIVNTSGYTLIAAGGGRTVDTSKVYYGALKRVIKPSTGYTEITYQAADYYDALSNSNQFGGGIRVKKLKTYGGDPGSNVTVTYKYRMNNTPTRSSGQWTYRPMFVAYGATGSTLGSTLVPYNIAPEESILYSRTEVSTMGKGKTVYEYQNLGLYNTTSSGDFSASLTRIARPSGSPCVSAGNLRTGYYTFPHAPNTNYDFERGLPLRISDYSRSAKLVSRKIYSYQRTTLPVTTISGIRYEAPNNVFQYSKYSILSNVNKITQTESSRIYDQKGSDSTANYVETVSTYTYNTNQMLSQVATTNSDNNIYSKNYLYAKDYASTGTDTQSAMINGLVNNNQHGTLIESYTKNGSNVTGAQLTLFNNNFGGGRILPMQQLVLGDPTFFVASSVSGNSFIYSNNIYYPVSYFDAYDSYGHATIIRDQSRMIESVIMDYGGELPVLNISNARNDQIVFSGYETSYGTATSSGGIVNSDSWSGKNSLSLSAGGTVTQSNIVKGLGNFYRFSCRAKGTSSATLSVQINGGAASTVSYSNAGNWQYVEMRVDMSTISGNFSFLLSTSASILLDDVAFYPESAAIMIHAYEPLKGKTSDSDSKGVSGFQEYDAMGRMHYLRNQDKDIVQIKDYQYISATAASPVSHFVYTPGDNKIYTNTSVTFTVDQSCVSDVSYMWYVDGVSVGTGTTLTYTFPQLKDYQVRQVATYNYGTSITEVKIHPLYPKPAITVSIAATEQGGSFNCTDATFERHLTATVAGNYESANLVYNWYSSTGLVATTTTNTFIVDLVSGHSNSFYCVVTSTFPNPITGNHDPVTGTSNTITYTWVPRTGC